MANRPGEAPEGKPEGMKKFLPSLQQVADVVRRFVFSLMGKSKHPKPEGQVIPLDCELSSRWVEETTLDQRKNDEEQYRLEIEGCTLIHVRLWYDGDAVFLYVSVPKINMQETPSTWEELIQIICGTVLTFSGEEMRPEFQFDTFIPPLMQATVVERRRTRGPGFSRS